MNSAEYKVMGLAPYGEPKYVQTIYDHLIDLKEDGSFRMNMKYFDYCSGLRMTNENFADLFGGPAREAEPGIKVSPTLHRLPTKSKPCPLPSTSQCLSSHSSHMPPCIWMSLNIVVPLCVA